MRETQDFPKKGIQTERKLEVQKPRTLWLFHDNGGSDFGITTGKRKEKEGKRKEKEGERRGKRGGRAERDPEGKGRVGFGHREPSRLFRRMCRRRLRSTKGLLRSGGNCAKSLEVYSRRVSSTVVT